MANTPVAVFNRRIGEGSHDHAHGVIEIGERIERRILLDGTFP
jgi:hypothetical protein